MASFETTAPTWTAFDAAKLPDHLHRGRRIWTIQCGVFPENTASLALHERAGFRVIGTRERVGRHYGRWRDVVLLERRSPVI